MNASYDRDLDLNLLRVFVVVAEAGSVTDAASRLYLTQPAVSAALKRLSTTVGAKLFVRSGRGLQLTTRGRHLLGSARPHLEALVEAASAFESFSPQQSRRTVRLGLSDANESWLLSPLLSVLAKEAPLMQIIMLPVQFRTVSAALASGAVDLAVSVADELPSDIRRVALFYGGFVCLHDPRHIRQKRLSLERYLAHEHVIVSYNGDLRGIVEDLAGLQRRVRLSLPSFHSVGAVVEGSALIATIPATVAAEIVALRPHLHISPLPFALGGAPMELLWRASQDDDPALAFLRQHIQSFATSRGKRSATS